MSGLTNFQLEKIAKSYLGNTFLGVFPCDANPNIQSKRQKLSFIFNLSKHDEPGSHYVAVIIFRKKIYFFDSYGKKLTNTHIKNFLRKLNLKIFYHTEKIQPKNSIFCGFYCLSYLIFMSKHFVSNFKPYFNMFIKPPDKQNDRIVTEYILENKKK